MFQVSEITYNEVKKKIPDLLEKIRTNLKTMKAEYNESGDIDLEDLDESDEYLQEIFDILTSFQAL